MALGSEVVLGWKGIEAVKEAAARLGIRFHAQHGHEFDESAILQPDMLSDDMEFGILLPDGIGTGRAYRAAIEGMGWRIVGVEDGPLPSFHLETPFGHREAYPWVIQLIHDPENMGDDYGTITLGIHLSSRYFPCFLDMESESGGIGNTIAFDKKTMLRIEVAKAAIIDEMPAFADADVIVRQMHY